MRSKVKSEFLVPPTHIRQPLTWCHICFSVPAHTRVVWFFFLRWVAFACVAHTTTVSFLRVNNLFRVPQPSNNSRWRNVSCVSGAVPSSSLQATEPFLWQTSYSDELLLPRKLTLPRIKCGVLGTQWAISSGYCWVTNKLGVSKIANEQPELGYKQQVRKSLEVS